MHLAPPPARAGTGLLAQRLVAAVLVLLPSAPARFDGARRRTTRLAPAGRRRGDGRRVAAGRRRRRSPPAGRRCAVDVVTVADGDTLFGLARTHLGDSARWREIFELNRDRLQLDGGRLTSPSLIRTGWRLDDADGRHRRAAAAAPRAVDRRSRRVAPAPPTCRTRVVVATGDTLWDLARDRLVAAGLDHGDVAVADYVHRSWRRTVT